MAGRGSEAKTALAWTGYEKDSYQKQGETDYEQMG
jgi:hypothetical protein